MSLRGPAAAAALVVALAGSAHAAPNYAGDFKLVGTEPFWDLTLIGGKVRYHTDLGVTRGHASGPVVGGGIARWAARAGGERFTIVLIRRACSDGMTERNYPYEAQLIYPGGGKVTGCAYRPKGR